MSDTVERAMLAIKTLDKDAFILLSEYTGLWYIGAKINVSDGIMMRGLTEHRSTPEQAVMAFLDALSSISLDEVVVAEPAGERREYRWNGAAFAEQYGDIRKRARERA